MKLGMTTLALICLLAGNAGAAAMEFPALDFQKFCEKKAEFFNHDTVIHAMCLQEEQAAMDAVGRTDHLSASDAQQCLDAARAAGESYTVLGLCLAGRNQASDGGAANASSSAPGLQNARQSSLPVYDVKKYCASVGEAVGGSAQVEKDCREEEDTALDALKEMHFPAKTWRYCDEMSRALGGSYQIFKDCAEEELEAQKSLESF